jgi:PKD repeat protein
MSWTRWLRSLHAKTQGSRARLRQKSRVRPSRLALERLEDRTVPSVRAASSAATGLISDTAAGYAQGPASVSKDGRYIVYADTAANLAANQVMDPLSPIAQSGGGLLSSGTILPATNIFLFDRGTGQTTLVSHAASNNNLTARGTSEDAVISADGKWVAFLSNSDDLLSNPTVPSGASTLGGAFEVYLYEVSTGKITLASHAVSSDTTLGNNSASAAAIGALTISQHGEYVGYLSSATNLLTGQTAGTGAQVFIYDRAADTNTLISHSSSSSTTGSNAASDGVVLSADGSTIVFTSKANNLISGQSIETGGPTAKFDNVFMAQLPSGSSWSSATVSLITHTTIAANVPTGSTLAATEAKPVNTSSVLPLPSITSNGQYIAYASTGTDLVSGESSVAGVNVYLYSTSGGTSTLVSHASSSSTTAGNSSTTSLSAAYAPAVSDDGQYVAFLSNSTNLTSTATTGANVFLYSSSGSSNTLVTASAVTPSTFVTGPTISGDGRYVAYVGPASSEMTGLTSLQSGVDALVYDRVAGSTTLVSRDYGSATTTSNGAASAPILSEDGSTIVYVDLGTNLIPTTINGHSGNDLNATYPGNGADLFAYTLNTPSTYTPVAGNGDTATASTGTNSTVTLRDKDLSSSTANGQSEIPPEHSISDNGRDIVFASLAPNLVAQQAVSSTAGSTQNVYLYDSTTQTTTLLSHATGSATTEANGTSFNPVVSGDGTTVLFFSTASNLVSGVTVPSGTVQLYLYSISSGALSLLTYASGSTTQASNSTSPFIPSTPSGSPYVNTLGYYAGVDAGLVGGGLALPSVSSNGQYITYISNATNLVSGVSVPTDGVSGKPYTEVYLYDRNAGTTTLVSHLASDQGTGYLTTGASGFASTTAISADGSTVAFTTPAKSLVSGESSDGVNDQLYIWSHIDNSSVTGLSAGQTVLASHKAGSNTTGATIPGSFLFGFTADTPPSLSANGTLVAYYDAGNNLVSSQAGTASVLNVFLYDVKGNTNTLVSHIAGTSATALATAGNNPANQVAPLGVGPAEATGPQISADGHYIAYANNSNNLISTTSTWTGKEDNVFLYDNNPSDAAYQTNILVSHADSSTTSNPTTTPDSGGGTAPSMSADGRYIAFLDYAYPNVSQGNSSTTPVVSVRLYDRLGTATTQPSVLGTAFDSGTSVNTVAGAIAPTVINADTADYGITVAWDGLASGNVSGDLNNNLDVFVSVPSTTTAFTVKAQPFTTPEGTSYTGQVASITDTDLTATASSYTATINWGDGNTTTGVVSGSNGSFTVSASGTGAHTYADEGSDTFTVTVQKGSQQQSDHATATVTEADTLSITGTAITPTEGTSFSGTVATFTTTYTGNVASDFVATIDWGDGNTTTGVVSGSNGSFTVSASGTVAHTYADEGAYSITVTVKDDSPGTATISAKTSITVGEADTLSVTASSISPTEGTALTNTQVATFTSTYSGNVAGDFIATIDWGDGSSTSAGVVSGSSGNFVVKTSSSDSHTYADEGTYTVTVTVTDDAPGTATKSGKTTVTVGEGDTLSASATSISPTEGSTLTNTQVATFTSTFKGNVASDFTATIDWGDGSSTSAGVVSGSSGSFVVKTSSSDSHTYADEGTYTVKITITDDAPGTATITASSNVTVSEADSLSASATAISSLTEGSTLTSTQVATFTSTYKGNVASDFTATIDWGDGNTSTGVVTGSSGSFVVKTASNDSHAYADEGTYTVKITIADDTPGTASITVSSTVTVTEADSLSATATSISPVEGTALTSTQVATFTSTYKGNVASDFTATIDWGDGSSTSTGVVTGSSGSFVVKTSSSDSHTYADEGTYTVKITIADDSPGTATITVSSNVTVTEGDSLSATATSISPTEGSALTSTQVATFTSTNKANVASDFTATIDWGDGSSTSAGVVSGSGGSFVVKTSSTDSHVYADEGTYTVKITITDDTPGTATITASSNVTVTEGDSLSATATSINPTEGSALTSTQVATFTSTYSGNVASDFTATIDWGDGSSTSTGVVSGSSGSFVVKTSSSDSHVYADEGTYTVKITITDDTPGTATITASSNVTIAEADSLSASATAIGTLTGGSTLTNTQMATFTSTYTANTASDFKATIDWGDGSSTSTGVVSGSSGSFVVKTSSSDSHMYADEGTYTVKITITDDTPGTATITVSSNVTVSASSLSATMTTINPTEGTALTGVQVASFTSSNSANTASDFTAIIDWGDGHTSTGVVSGSSGSFVVKTASNDTHTYADEGTVTVTITIKDDSPSTVTATASGSVNVGEGDSLSATATSISPTEGSALTSTQVATFTSTYTGNVASDFTASIDWGDGSSTSTGVVSGSGGNFVVSTSSSDSHVYADEGTYTVKITIKDDTPGTASVSASSSVSVGEADSLSASVTEINTTSEGATVANTQVATFTSTYTDNTASDFTATIDWGDGHTSAGVITGSNGSFVVKTSSNDSHVYADEGTYTVTITINDDTPGTATVSASGSIIVAEADTLSATITTINPIEGTALTGVQVATFTSSNTGNVAGDFTATIDWGDGNTSTGVITGSNGSFVVKTASNDTHTYADENDYTVSVTIQDDSPGTASVTVSQTVAPAEADTIDITLTSLSATANVPLDNVQVATFTTTNLTNTQDDFTATIDWGDGNTTTGVITGSDGNFSVSGSHTYTTSGAFTVRVAVFELAQSDANATQTTLVAAPMSHAANGGNSSLALLATANTNPTNSNLTNTTSTNAVLPSTTNTNTTVGATAAATEPTPAASNAGFASGTRELVGGDTTIIAGGTPPETSTSTGGAEQPANPGGAPEPPANPQQQGNSDSKTEEELLVRLLDRASEPARMVPDERFEPGTHLRAIDARAVDELFSDQMFAEGISDPGTWQLALMAVAVGVRAPLPDPEPEKDATRRTWIRVKA